MDEVENKLMNAARELAAVSQSRLQVTTAEIGELEEQLRQLKAQREGQVDAQGRLRLLPSKNGGEEDRCPNCWIRDRESTLLKSIPFERPEQDVMRCPACGRDFGISLRAQAHV